jgi:putative addiction module component (TIGR02574 family)
MTESTEPDLSVSEELLAELHRRLEAHLASPEDSEPWEIVEKRIFGDD